jgi:ubiquinone/menaquinone biosynthesis C-methylase UbiE
MNALRRRSPRAWSPSPRHKVRTHRRPQQGERLAYHQRTMERDPTPQVNWGPGLHVAVGHRVNTSAYEQYIGRWSRLFVPTVLASAEVAVGDRLLDVATGPGEAAAIALSLVGPTGLVVGVDISPAMLDTARTRFGGQRFWAAAMDAQALAFPAATFDCVVCQLGLMFFPDPARGVAEFRRVLRPGRRAAVCVISTPERAPMWGVLADTLSRYLPDHRDQLHLSFALADAARLERMLGVAGFRDITVKREQRDAVFESFDEYWSPIEAGIGSLPQAYRALPEGIRQAVRREVEAGLSRFKIDGRLAMSVEMLIATGRA